MISFFFCWCSGTLFSSHFSCPEASELGNWEQDRELFVWDLNWYVLRSTHTLVHVLTQSLWFVWRLVTKSQTPETITEFISLISLKVQFLIESRVDRVAKVTFDVDSKSSDVVYSFLDIPQLSLLDSLHLEVKAQHQAIFLCVNIFWILFGIHVHNKAVRASSEANTTCFRVVF